MSVHFPKTAGTSFGLSLRQCFAERLQEDYAMLPFNQPAARRVWQAVGAGIRRSVDATWPDAIHGHFLPVKYRIALRGRPAHYVTWLRDPVERLLSHYYYWQRTADAATPAQPLRYRMAREQWSLERFCFAPELRDLYRQCLWGFPPERFSFIGITEHYETDLACFASRFLGDAPAVSMARVNAERVEARYRIDPGLRLRIEQHHRADMRLYRWALRERERRAAA
ncbi:MAG: hypothetical protein ACJ8GK_07645 [Luteimonas sp.]